MQKKDILEIKKRFKKNDCTFTKMRGCYVNSEKNILFNLEETFLALPEETFYKYLEIAKKTLSGKLGNNLLELNLEKNNTSENYLSDKQEFLMNLKRSALKDNNLLNQLYKSIIDNYEYDENYLILLFHDAYDVMKKTSDNRKLDESEEVYEYILCAICPVSLSKPGLAYLEDENTIGARVRDWVVEMPTNGFIFPAFTDRSSDIDALLYYTKNPKDTHPELMECVLGCNSLRTASEQKEIFTSINEDAISDKAKSEEIISEIHENINILIEENDQMGSDEPVTINNSILEDVLMENGISDEITEKIENSYEENFKDNEIVAENFVDSKVLAANNEKKKEKALKKEIEILKEKLDDKKTDEINETVSIDTSKQDNDNSKDQYDVVLYVKPDKVSKIKSQLIDGDKCLVIPLTEDEKANINGETKILE